MPRRVRQCEQSMRRLDHVLAGLMCYVHYVGHQLGGLRYRRAWPFAYTVVIQCSQSILCGLAFESQLQDTVSLPRCLVQT